MQSAQQKHSPLDSAVEFLRRGEPLTKAESKAVLEFIEFHSRAHRKPRPLPDYLRLVAPEDAASDDALVMKDK